MSEEALAPLTLAGFDAAVAVSNGAFALSLRGNGDMSVSAILGRYLKDVDALCVRDHVRVLEVRLDDLYFLSSSCFQALASWVLAVAARAPESRYTVRFLTNAAQPWQKRSLEAIRRVAPASTVVL